MRTIAFYLFLLLSVQLAIAQNTRYEYWMDNDYDGRASAVGDSTSAEITLDLNNVTPGLHFFNFRTQGNTGRWGGLSRYMFFVQDIVSATTRYEYWMDNDYEGRVTMEGDSTSAEITLDLNNVTPGLHFFNFRTQGNTGLWGGLSRFMFFVQEVATATTRYEYWMDNDYEGCVTMEGDSLNAPIIVDLNSVTPGLHFFNFRTQGNTGRWGGLARYMFFVQEQSSNIATTCYEYWMDNDYDNRIISEGDSLNAPITIDLSNVTPGLHFFNFRTQGNTGRWGGLARYMFFLQQSPTELTRIRYWLDEQTDRMQTQEVTDSTVMIAVDISYLENGVHSFCLEGITNTGNCCMFQAYEFEKGDSLIQLLTETVTAYSSPSFRVALETNGGTSEYFNSYYRIGNGGSLTLRGKRNVINIVDVTMNLQEPSRTGADLTVSAGTLNGNVIEDVNDTTLTITANGKWPQLWATSLTVTYMGTPPAGTYAIRLPQYQTHGSVTSDMDWADEGDEVTLTATPEEGYHLARLYANRGAVTLTASAAASNQYTFTMPAEDVTIGAVFAEGDVTTGLLLNVPEDGATATTATPIYNLQGQRLTRLQRGINIVGGRKRVKSEKKW